MLEKVSKGWLKTLRIAVQNHDSDTKSPALYPVPGGSEVCAMGW